MRAGLLPMHSNHQRLTDSVEELDAGRALVGTGLVVFVNALANVNVPQARRAGR